MGDWTDVGPGAAPNEIIRTRPWGKGLLVATVWQRKAYSTRTSEPETIVVSDEQTRSVVFVPDALTLDQQRPRPLMG